MKFFLKFSISMNKVIMIDVILKNCKREKIKLLKILIYDENYNNSDHYIHELKQNKINV